MKVEYNKDLESYNSYKISMKSRYFIELKKEQDFFDFYELFEKKIINNFFIIGEGFNSIFVRKKYDGYVIKISNNFIEWKKTKKVEVGAGKNWDKFLAACQKKNFYDIQSMSSIPGSVGAGVFGNIGAFGQEIKNYILEVRVLDLKDGKIKTFDYKKMNFTYRNSFIKKKTERYVIYSVIFDFSQKFKKELNEFYNQNEYFDLNHFFKKNNLGKVKKEDIRKTIKKIRKKTYPDIEKFPNVGSTFKNIEVSITRFKIIQKKYPEIPFWKMDNGKIKIPTAYIFDKILKIKGEKTKNIMIDNQKPLFLINMGGATGEEFFNLVQKIKKKVKKKLNLDLDEEVRFLK